MVYFSKLKLYGFKSFVDKAEIEIGEGLNGIVGPNGCGKSNLVEALRWVMGEKSAKNMRGGGMEDVIFAGTSKRPARNMAEATIIIDNSDGTAPAPFTSATEIEITRRIEKDKGSQYRVNGKAVRARDVNLLFADTMTGANSPALVSQGRISEIIMAKPQDRRRVLEESAGISGLHTRRHEAELRLRAAEQNLTRLDDSLNDMRSRLTSLKRQSRQAERYKELSASIRRLDMALVWSEWRDARGKIKDDRAAFESENAIVQKALEETQSLTKQIDAIEADLPTLRTENMEARAILQNFRVSLERLEQDIQTKAQGLKEAEQSKAQLDQDLTFTQTQLDQTNDRLNASTDELEQTKSNGETLPDVIAELQIAVDTLKEQLSTVSQDRQDIETGIAVAEQSKAQHIQQRDDYQRRLTSLEQSRINIQSGIDSLNAELATFKNDPALRYDCDKAQADLDAIETKQNKIRDDISTQSDVRDELKSNENMLSADLRALQSEMKTLQDLVSRAEQQSDLSAEESLLNHLKVHDGFEKAVSTALGHWASMAGMNDTATVYWGDNGVSAGTPDGFTSLADKLNAPQSLNALFSAIGVTDTLPDALPSLNAGQMIVSMDGGLMRWDGLIVKAEASNSSDTTSLILEQRNRITALAMSIKDKEQEQTALQSRLESAEEALVALKDTLLSLQSDYQTQNRQLIDARHAQDRLGDKITNLENRIVENKEQLTQANQDYDAVQQQLKQAEDTLRQYDDSEIEKSQGEIAKLDEKITAYRVDLDDKQSALAKHKFELSAQEQSIRNLTSQIERLNSDKSGLEQRLKSIETRLEDLDIKIRDYKQAQDIESEDNARESLLSKISDQEKTVTEINTKLEEREQSYKSVQTALRQAEANAASAREKRAMIQANIANAEEDLRRIEANIAEKFETNPQALEEETLSLFGDGLPPIADLHAERDTVSRQRDSIGPVNLRAAIETQETEGYLAEMEVEYNDLTKAIEQLRGGISKLNREARERLGVAFKRVDAHFQKLFADLFTGGKAYLEMIESEDPLESGLEIYAQPPGKALQKLSLLSGGEQTLTATALIFAMFLTNPSPICVLDEIDAPLDDANVDRVCTLMEKIARETDTRFIVITHHRMTMARMDRLYGVTMSERGVSQLVSVDMALQEELALGNDSQESA